MSRTTLALSLSLSLAAGLAACSSPTNKSATVPAEPRDAGGADVAQPVAEAEADADTAALATDDERRAPGRTEETKRKAEEVLRAQVAQEPPKPAPPPVMAVAPNAYSGAIGATKSVSAPASAGMAMPLQPLPQDTEKYAHVDQNPIHVAATDPVSTFSIDVDTGSYSNVRRFLRDGRLPPQDAVRVEELINYFDYGYAPPRDRSLPFAVTTEIAPSPWNAKTQLMHIGIQGWKPEGKSAGSNLVFLVDVSGSMDSPDKLPLVVSSLKMLTKELGQNDRISLVVYAGASGVVLPPTAGNDKAKILAALDQLAAGGSTNGASGIELAYNLAKQGWIEGGVNRVLLATDGDFNVGIVDFEQLVDMVETRRKSGIALTTLGFGTGNYNDQLMERLADAGDGNYAYIDSAEEAQKVLVRQREGTLTTIARDVKIQVEFNPAVVAEYRLIGYENRALKREDFGNDKVDAGEIGAGHTVTALYEVALVGSGGERNEALRYAAPVEATARGDEIAMLRLRYKRPQDGVDAQSKLIERPLMKRDILANASAASPQFRLAASVAAFGQMLTGGRYTGTFDYTAVDRLASSAGDDPFGERAEFRRLVKVAASLANPVGATDTKVNVGG